MTNNGKDKNGLQISSKKNLRVFLQATPPSWTKCVMHVQICVYVARAAD